MPCRRAIVALLLLTVFVGRTTVAMATAPCLPGHHGGHEAHQTASGAAGDHQHPFEAPEEGCGHHGPDLPAGNADDCVMSAGCAPAPAWSATSQALWIPGDMHVSALELQFQVLLQASPPASPPPRR